VIAPYDHEALWIKAKLFINRAMDIDEIRSPDERSLWAALALELLAKAALAKVSPLLIAEPTEEGVNLLIASGLIEADARFTSVRAKTLFLRCQRAFRPFDLTEAMGIVNGRNEYLHGGGVGFATLPDSVWWPKFWAQAIILVSALDKDIDEFVGSARKHLVDKHLEQNAKNVEHRTEALIGRAKQRLLQMKSGVLPAKIVAEWRPGRDLSAGLSYSTSAACPACGNEGVLEGDSVLSADINYPQGGDEYDEVSVTLDISSDYFSCPICHLVLDGYQYIGEAELPLSFEAEGDPSDYYDEPDYGND
jgi:hypothetical protein